MEQLILVYKLYESYCAVLDFLDIEKTSIT
jgi:hypothetical protein